MALQTQPQPTEEPIKKKDESWIETFLESEKNSFFCRISDSYLADNFELYELDGAVTNYKFALNLLRNRRKETFEHLTTEQKKTIEHSAKTLYGLIHARFIITKRGLEKMKRKYISNDFGKCQRNNCNEQSLLPTAITDEKGKECVRLYCSNCCDIYLPRKECYKNIDGAYFGTTFAHLFLLAFPIFKPKQSITRTQNYTPKIFGFRLHNTWHDIALKEWNQKHYENNEFEHKEMNQLVNDNHNNEIHYLIALKDKQKNEIMRLEDIIKKQQTEINKINSLNKKQSIQLLSLKTRVQIMDQQAMDKAYNNTINNNTLLQSAPIPIQTTVVDQDDDAKELENKYGFEDILKQLKEKEILIKSKNERKVHGINMEQCKNQLDEICHVSNALKLYLNQSSNGI
eukprot:243176_1